MKPVSDVSALVFDNGLFLPLAQKLAESYKRVFYFTPWERGFPVLKEAIIGDGFDNIVRVDDIWSVYKEVDLFVFPDIQHSGLQLHLESEGKRVWGSRKGDSLELSREKFLKTLERVGLDVPPHVRVKGLTALREHLKDKSNKFIKISRFRGDLETARWVDWDTSRALLDVLALQFGPAADDVPFLVCDEIETDIELGCDTFCIDGQWPDLMIHGYEAKDKGFLSAVTKYQDMPDQLKEVLESFGPILKRYRYRNSFSAEIRVADNKSYFIDPCCRFPMPPTSSKTELWGNLAEIVWQGAHGVMVNPEPTAMFAAECEVSAKAEKGAWVSMEVPKELRRWFKASNCCQIDGRLCFPPAESDERHLGWLVSTGDKIDEVLDTLKERAGLMPPSTDVHIRSMIDLLQELHTAEKQGIEFTDQPIPEPEDALEV